MGAATARKRPAVSPVRGQSAPVRDDRARPAEKSRKSSQESRLFGKLILVVILIGAAVFAILGQRIAIMNYQFQADELRKSIDKETLERENLEAKVAVAVASPKIQQTAASQLGMSAPGKVYYVQSGAKVDSKVLAADLSSLDKSAWRLKAYRADLAAKAKAEKEKAALLAAQQAEPDNVLDQASTRLVALKETTSARPDLANSGQ